MAILPRRVGLGWAVSNAQSAHLPLKDETISAVIVPDEKARCVDREGCRDLKSEPKRRGVMGDLNMQNPPPVVAERDKGEQTLKHQCAHRQHIYGCDIAGVFMKKIGPAAARTVLPPEHVFRYGRLSNTKAQLQQLAMDARRAPEWIFKADAPNQGDQFWIEPRPSASPPVRKPSPQAFGQCVRGEQPTRQIRLNKHAANKTEEAKDDEMVHIVLVCAIAENVKSFLRKSFGGPSPKSSSNTK